MVMSNISKTLSSGVYDYIQEMGFQGMMCTKMSVPPYVCWSQWANLVAESSLRTSRGWKAMRFDPTSRFNDATALFPRVSSRAVMTVVKPLCASWRAISYPIPLLAPVTTATVSLDHHLRIHKYNRINPIPICNTKLSFTSSAFFSHGLSIIVKNQIIATFWLRSHYQPSSHYLTQFPSRVDNAHCSRTL